MTQMDTRLGQLAIARGLIDLSSLLRCVEEAGRSERDLADVLISTGVLSFADLAELEERLAGKDPELQVELERGQTIVLDELYNTHGGDTTELLYSAGTDDSAPVLDVSHLDLELTHDDRYKIDDELGVGGMGRVFLAHDQILRRNVAMKTLVRAARNEKGRARLLLEAQVTGLLEHPSIVPVYDLRSARDGEPFYTMRVVRERSLGQILDQITKGETAHSLTNLVSILRQVSLAIQFAHDLGVVHRDLKPENILVGKYGEVYVIDWGVAKIVSSEIGLEQTGRVVMGQLVGTPQYMAPEQARGDNDAVDERSDVYALGAILYEILTLGPMFDADHVLAILFQVAHDAPQAPTERAPQRSIPEELEEICLRAVRKRPDDRYQSAQEFADELELFLEGVKERERQREMAEDAMQQAMQVRAVYEDVREQRAEILARLADEREQVESWAGPTEKADLWGLEQQAEDLEVEIERRFGEVVRAYAQALVHQPDMGAAREALADLYWERFQEYESTGRLAQAAYFESLVRQYNDGQYDDLLEGTALLQIESDPPGAEVTIYRYQQVGRRLVEWRVAALTTPASDVSVSHGSHVLEFVLPGHRSVNVPVLVERASRTTVSPRLYADHAVPDNFVVIPQGEFITGKVADGGQVERAWTADFAIAQHPVTAGEYISFLNALVESGDEEKALKHTPRDDDRVYFSRDDQGRFFLPETDTEGDRWDERWPMIIVNYHDASAYAEWYAAKMSRPFRLPTIREWEKAARGVDGRIYAWGDHFDPAFCLMRGSRKGRALPDKVGSFPIDRSPYGVVDVCGGVAEWTSTKEEGSEEVHYLGGASYNSFAEMCRLDFVLSSPTVFRFGHYGFRLALSLDDS